MNRLTSVCLDRPGGTLIALLAVTLLLGMGGLRLELRTDGEALHPSDDPVVDQSARDRSRFRDRDALLLLVNAGPESTLASPRGFRFLRDLHTELRHVDGLRPGGILSLAGLPRLVQGAGGISVGTHLDRIPEDQAGFDALLEEVRARPLTDGLMLSPDGRRALFSLPLAEGVTAAAAVRALESFCEERRSSEFELLLGGPLVAETTLGTKVLLDLAVLVPLMLLVLVALLFAMLRSPGGVMAPVLATLVALIWTFGAMGWAGAPIALVTTILPVVLMAMCITDEIHLLERLAGHWSEPTQRARLEAALGDVERPIVLTSLTTAFGFLSFTTASIGPLREFGLFAAFGILVAMLLTFTLVPALIVLLPERLFTPRRGLGARGLEAFGRFAAQRPGVGFALGAASLLVLLPGLPLLRVDDAWVENFDPNSPLVRAEQGINESFWGSYRFDVVFEGAPGTFRDPDGVGLLEAFTEDAIEAPYVGGVETHLLPLEEIAVSLGAAPPLSALPAPRLWDLFTLAEMSESRAVLEPLLTPRGDAARARLYVKSPDYARAQELARAIEATLPALLAPTEVRAHASGDLPVASALVESIVRNQLRSIGWALLTVAGVLLVFSRQLRALLAMVPVLAASAALFGFMGLAGIELGIATSMFASLTVGVGVDFGIHFLHRFDRERATGLGHGEAIRATIEKAGRALFWNAVALAGGFSVLAASSLKPNHALGLLLAGAMLACYAGCMLLLPYLLRLGSGAAALAVACAALALSPPARAADPRCGGPPDPGATRLMERIERGSRAVPRILRMHITTEYTAGGRLARALDTSPEPRTIWGVANGDPDDTWMLFVFSGPGRMAGTTLLIRDVAGSGKDDAMWLYLRAFEHFERLQAGAERVVVPGTALTYEDARGFIASEKYRFHRPDRLHRPEPRPEDSGSAILGCPRTPAIAEALGYGALLVDVDPQAGWVRRVDYRGPGGAPIKEYAVQEPVRHGEHVFPARARLEDLLDGFRNEIAIEYWEPRAPPPPELFRPDLESGTFRERLRRFLKENGLAQRIDLELEQADARVQAYEERMRALEKEGWTP
jgi:predicted RND superfamily exporter protein